MITREEIAHIGKFNKPHGIAGEISATILGEAHVLEQCKCFVCNVDGIFVPFFIAAIREKSRDTVLVKIDGINNEIDASMLVNHDIYVLKSEYSQSTDRDELPVDFFLNYDVIINVKYKGRIIDVDDTTANVLFVIKMDDGQKVLIPVVDEFIIDIDTESRCIEMELPQELLEL
ncbi:MAG: 16S rRNA processing protein RimM [Muribaculaceae bacterium]|nr:16S rRNA processing protein RimM [Muribaculaceae bacterium]